MEHMTIKKSFDTGKAYAGIACGPIYLNLYLHNKKCSNQIKNQKLGG